MYDDFWDRDLDYFPPDTFYEDPRYSRIMDKIEDAIFLLKGLTSGTDNDSIKEITKTLREAQDE